MYMFSGAPKLINTLWLWGQIVLNFIMFNNRFTRNANIVASGVAKNVRKVGNQIKESVDDILYPYRRRPK